MAPAPSIVVGLNAVIVAVTDEEPRLLTVERPEQVPAASRSEPALPFGPLDPAGHRTLELGLRAWVREQTGLELGYVEQLYTFADRNRDPRERGGGPRVVSIAYLALVREGRVAGGGQARWRGFYEFLPWEDARARPAGRSSRSVIAPALARWVSGRARRGVATRAPRARRHHVRPARRDLRQRARAGALRAALRGRPRGRGGAGRERRLGDAGRPRRVVGAPMALDHRRLMATALGRLRGKLKYRPVVFELLPTTFTLLRLQRVVEALAGVPAPQAELPAPGREGRAWSRGPGSTRPARSAVPPSSSASAARCCASAGRRAWACRRRGSPRPGRQPDS